METKQSKKLSAQIRFGDPMKLIKLEDNLFAQLAKKRGYLVEEASRKMIQAGIDLILKGIYKAKNKKTKELTTKESKAIDLRFDIGLSSSARF